MSSPYEGLTVTAWRDKTIELIKQHPLDNQEIYDIVLTCWNNIFYSQIGSKPFKIGVDLFPAPQIMGFFLHELIPLELEFRKPMLWRKGQSSNEKDLVYVSDSFFSIEIKTSSSQKNIYGNRSYAQGEGISRKNKAGYYLAINFDKFSPNIQHPQINLVRFGWLDHSDWLGQTAATGQQARLNPDVERYKLLVLPLE